MPDKQRRPHKRTCSTDQPAPSHWAGSEDFVIAPKPGQDRPIDRSIPPFVLYLGTSPMRVCDSL